MVASMSTISQPQQQQSPADSIQPDQEQLYYAQLFAVQQQQQAAAAAANASSSPSNSSNKSGGERDKNGEDGNGGNGRKESDREKKEREWSERNTNLIVNYVPQNMTQEEVRALFGSMGEVESCKLIRDKLTGQSLGYAFVNFERPEDAQKALISMNGLRIQNKTLKVSLARPSKDDIKGANLYVSGLPKSLTQPELEAAFRKFGSIITSRILYDNVTGLSKGVGFVRFDRKSEAEDAIEKMTGTMPWGGDEAVAVKFANSPSTNSTKSSSSSAIQMAQSLIPLQILQSATPTAAHQLSLPSLLPAGLPQSSVAGGPIHGHAPQHRFRYSPLAGAPLISASAPVAIASTAPSAVPSLSAINPLAGATAQSAGTGQEYLALLQQQLLQQQLTAVGAFGTNPSLAAAAATANSQQQNFATQMAVQQQYAAYAAALGLTSSAGPTLPLQSVNGIGQSKSPSSTGWTLSVGNLAGDTDDSTLWKLFGPFGAVLSTKSMKGKGIGLVTMANYEEALTAIAGLNGQQLGGRTIQVGFGGGSTLPSLIR